MRGSSASVKSLRRRCLRVRLHVAARNAEVFVKLAARRLEGVAHRDMGILMRVILPWLTPHHDGAPRQRQIGADVEQPSLGLVAMMHLHHNVARGDPVAELFQLGDASANALLQRFGHIHITEGDARFMLHD